MAPGAGDGRHYLTVAEVAEELGVLPETVRRWIRGRELPATAIGGRKAGYRILKPDLEAYLAARYHALGQPGQPIGVAIARPHHGEPELGSPQGFTALERERAVFALVTAGNERTGAPLCFTCGSPAEVHPRARGMPDPYMRCTNPACADEFGDVVSEEGLCDCDREERLLHAPVLTAPSPEKGPALHAWGCAECQWCDRLSLYHWVRTPRTPQVTIIRWEGERVRRSHTIAATAFEIKKVPRR